MFLTKIRQKLNGTNLGLLPEKKDPRDLGFRFIFGTDYKPKHIRKKLNLPFPAKLQHFNTCGWTASAGAKEYDEQLELDERTLIMFGRKDSKISGDGFSTLSANEAVLKKYGIAEKGLIDWPWSDWEDYSDPKLIDDNILNNAAKHKTKSYLHIYHADEVYRAIDDGRPVRGA